MSLYKEWINEQKKGASNPNFWGDWFELEKSTYQKILQNDNRVIEGTLKEIASDYDLTPVQLIAFMDGIKESLNKDLEDLDSYEEDSQVLLDINYEKLLYNMHQAKAQWLYNLEEWDKIFSKEKQKEIEDQYHYGRTVVKGPKIGRNEPCPCGSGKKYKNCHGKRNSQALRS